MNRQPLSDELPYRFVTPRLDPICLWLGRRIGPRMLCGDHKVVDVSIEGESTLRERIGRGDAVMICPNHTDHADSHLMFALSRRVASPFYYMIAYQILQGSRKWFLPRVGAFPVDREGTDVSAFKTAVEVLARGLNPLVIFTEGEIYHLGDRVSPLREGAVGVATTAAKRARERGKTVWIVPVGIKYRYLETCDPIPGFHDVLDALERRLGWRVDRSRPLAERIDRYAQGMMALKEVEYFGEPRPGGLPERLKTLREFLLQRAAAKRLPASRMDAVAGLSVPERVKEIRRACLDLLADPALSEADRASAREDLHDVFVAYQTFCYPGDYLVPEPTVERVGETIMKFEEDFLGVHEVTPHAPRHAIIKIGEPIDVGARLADFARPRQAVGVLTDDLQERLQALLDALGPGRALPARECRIAPGASPPGDMAPIRGDIPREG